VEAGTVGTGVAVSVAVSAAVGPAVLVSIGNDDVDGGDKVTVLVASWQPTSRINVNRKSLFNIRSIGIASQLLNENGLNRMRRNPSKRVFLKDSIGHGLH
jgi:hypothetical protein